MGPVKITQSLGMRHIFTASAVTREFAIALQANVHASLDSKVRVAGVLPAPTAAVDMDNVSTWLYPITTALRGTRRRLSNASVTPDTLVLTVLCASALSEVTQLLLCTSTTKVCTKSNGSKSQAKNGVSKKLPTA